MSIKNQVFIYHLTSIKNLESILNNGLLCRYKVLKKKYNYTNVANLEILQKREEYDLDKYVPFHWRSKSPFAGDVLKCNKTLDFCYILIRRTVAKSNNFKIIPTHPLHGTLELLNYDEGFNKIDWDLMDTRNYHDQNCKETSMSECLAFKAVSPRLFDTICVKDTDGFNKVYNIISRSTLSEDDKNRLQKSIWKEPDFFVK